MCHRFCVGSGTAEGGQSGRAAVWTQGKEGSTAGSTAAPPGPGWGRGVGLRTSASGGSHAVPGAAVQVAGAADGAAVHPQEDQRLGGWTSFSPQEESAVVRRAGV